MKRRLYEKKSKKRDLFLVIVNGLLIYWMLSWDFVFGDVFALAPGYMITIIYALNNHRYISVILSAFYAIVWSLYYSAFIWMSPLFFIVYSLMAFFIIGRWKEIQKFYCLFYLLEGFFCLYFYNQGTFVSTQLIQMGLYLLTFFHLKRILKRK
ncbi:MAG TPA: hypothetical protein P5107_02610 [Thermotogota bacterium]|nr:hypothetical protein [Thermotogota bacterium]HRW33930.1 hypothetical protein [Thermotogota bacterium]